MMPMRVSVASTSTSTSTSTSVSPGTAPNAKPEDVQKTLEPHRGAAAAARAEPTVQTEQSSTAGGSTAPAVAEVRPERVTPLIDIVADTAALTAQSEAPQTIAPGVVAAASQRVVQDQPDPTTVGAAPIDQVAPALVGVLNATDGTQSVTVRLQPSELGQVTIRVDRSSEGMAHVNITADRPETLQLLQRDEPRLQQTLDQAGVPSSGRSVTFQATPPDQVGASAARPDTMEAGSGGSGQGQSGGAWRESGDGRQSSGNDAALQSATGARTLVSRGPRHHSIAKDIRDDDPGFRDDGNAASTTGGGTDALTSLSSNFSSFLNLLMTQLQNQDPTSPMDANSFTSELVEFSSVEQQINTNTSLTQLIQLTQAADVTQSSAILGKQVTVQSTEMPLQNGSGTLNFTAPTAEPVSITVQNANGITLQQANVNATQGANTWQWNGTNSNGQQLPDGAYTVVVSGGGTGAAATSLPFTVVGTATGVTTANNSVNLQLGALSVPFTAVTSVGP